MALIILLAILKEMTFLVLLIHYSPAIMKKKLRALRFSIILSVSFIASSAQPPLENYNIVILKGNLVKNILNTYSKTFSLFDFGYKQLSNKSYSLVVTAKDANNNQLQNEITLAVMIGQPARPLKNLQKGHLYLTLETMQQNHVDGSEDYILTPKKCRDKTGNLVDYVSYRFSNRQDNSTSGFFLAPMTIDFDLNPSPPY